MEVSQKFSFGQCDQMLKNVAQVFPTVAQKVANQLDLKSDGFTTAQKVTKHLGNKFIAKKLKKNRPIWSHCLQASLSCLSASRFFSTTFN